MAVLLYHDASGNDRESFHGNEFFTSSNRVNGALGSIAYVVEKLDRESPPRLLLRGRFKVLSIDDNPGDRHGYESFTHRLNLERTALGSERIDNQGWFNWDEFRNAPSNSNIYGVGVVSSEYSAHFDQLLDNSGAEMGEDVSVTSGDALSADLRDIENSEDLSDTEKKTLVKSRLGQGKFRSNAIKAWGGRTMCALTGVAIPEIIIASHIVPWRESTGERQHERLDGCNGIPLSASVDKLFDRYLISFQRVGSSAALRVSKRLNISALATIGLDSSCELVPNAMSVEERQRFFAYMERHYALFCEYEENR